MLSSPDQKPFSLEQYQALIDTSTVLEQDRCGVKVLVTAQGQMVKLFRRKRVWSSALLKSYAVRFVEHARNLAELGIETVVVQDLYYCQAKQRHLVFYDPVPGQTLRAELAATAEVSSLMSSFAWFLSELHHKGVLFRSVHFGNIIVLEDRSGFGLIDIADMQLKNRALTATERARNFRHMSRYVEDLEALDVFGAARFLQIYLEASNLADDERGPFRRGLARYAPLFSAVAAGS